MFNGKLEKFVDHIYAGYKIGDWKYRSKIVPYSSLLDSLEKLYASLYESNKYTNLSYSFFPRMGKKKILRGKLDMIIFKEV